MALRKNQIDAIKKSVNDNFESGVHFHATGTGKSWIGLEIILKYNKKYPKNNILWLCEQKSILKEQFNPSVIKEKGYSDIYNKFNILNYTEKKPRKWYEEFNKISRRSKLLIINRSFLVSQKKYEKLTDDINLIIHDECHSIKNKTTREFYDYILKENEKLSCIGFSATPILDYKPYDKVLSEYTIHDAYIDRIIVKPIIKWVKTEKKLEHKDIIILCKKLIKKLPYKKIIVWCGMIELCEKLSIMWKKEFREFLVVTDTSKTNNNNYEEYSDREENAILFCAKKHREGSDIKNLDCCIFLDKVENRSSKTFVQSIGRVLRKDKDNKKHYGLIIDLKASSCLKICDRMNQYLNCESNFPWKYDYKYKTINSKKILINKLKLLKNQNMIKDNINYENENLIDKFILECPNNNDYKLRLEKELKLIKEKNLVPYLLRAVKILKLTNNIPHVTRGSCGSSLVCYLLGISNVDPVKNNIKFERFLNQYRNNLPDIDLDFPHYLRDEVFLKLELNWPNQVARISNHVYWHDKSALREAIRRIGYRKQIPKEKLIDFLKSLPKVKRDKVNKIKKELEDTFRHYSLHCGGIVFYPGGVPENLKLNGDKNTITQIICDKRDVAKEKNFKIDILSSRGISQLIGIVGKNINFRYCPYDEKTYKLLQSGFNIGVTLAESPLMRKALLKIKPKSIDDIATCLAIIRPAAKDARLKDTQIDYGTDFIYDDDAITILAKKLNIELDLADKFRRCFSKGKWEPELKEKYDNLIKNLSKEDKKYIKEKLNNLQSYSFCKSHSYSYAQLVYKLAYQKAHNPKKFWYSTIRNVRSSYRKWVHLYEAKLAGVNIQNFIHKAEDVSIYAENRRKKFFDLSIVDQMKTYGYWDMNKTIFFPNCYFYKKDDVFYYGGLIASMRILHNNTGMILIAFLCVAPRKYIEIISKYKYHKPKSYMIKGRAMLKDENEQRYESFITRFI